MQAFYGAFFLKETDTEIIDVRQGKCVWLMYEIAVQQIYLLMKT